MPFKAHNPGHVSHTSEKDVLKAQKWLRNLGSTVQENGRYTIGMVTAVRSFQQKHKLPATGELDELTWKVLKRKNSWIGRLLGYDYI